MDTTIQLDTGVIPLGALLKLAGAAESGGDAKHLVAGGHVTVNGEVETRRGAKVRPGDEIRVARPGAEEVCIRTQ